MNTSDLADAVASAANLSKADARKAVDAAFAAITEAATRGEEVSLNGFGKFKVKETAAREGRNPATGAVIKIPAKTTVKFAIGKAMKDSIS